MSSYMAICDYKEKCKSENPEKHKGCQHKMPHKVSKDSSCVTNSCNYVRSLTKARCVPVQTDWDE